MRSSSSSPAVPADRCCGVISVNIHELVIFNVFVWLRLYWLRLRRRKPLLFFIFIKPNLGLVLAGQEGRLLNNRLECRFSRDNDPSVKAPNDPELDKV